MSDESASPAPPGTPDPGWWQASDGGWYPPWVAPAARPPAPGPPAPAARPENGWWQASDGAWYPPWLAPGMPPPHGSPPAYPPPPAAQGSYWHAGPPGVSYVPPDPPNRTSRTYLDDDPFSALRPQGHRGLLIAIGSIVGLVVMLAVVGPIVVAVGRSIGTTTTVAVTFPTVSLPPMSSTPAPPPPPPPVFVHLSVGQKATFPANSADVASIRVLAFTIPYTDNQSFDLVPGTEYAVASVQECAGAAPMPAGPSDDGWSLVTSAGVFQAYGPDVAKPGLQQTYYLAAHECATGYISFGLPPGATATQLRYQGPRAAAAWILGGHKAA